MSNGLIFMTALLPTKGHKYLIDFASEYLSTFGDDWINELHVIISSRSFEPVAGHDRVCDFKHEFVDKPQIIFHHHLDDNAPQNPNGDNDIAFWNYWKNIAHQFIGDDIDFVFASESYGVDVAKSLEAKFIPCDVSRSTINIKSTDVRKDIVGKFEQIMMTTQPYFKQTVTIFGAESCGKTTTTKKLHELHNSHIVLEWARTYLEAVGPDLSEEKMFDIASGQNIAQYMAWKMVDKPYIFQDTDLLSTIGYYRILKMEVPEILIDWFEDSKSDLYVVMNSNIPFEEDILRYGGNVRESTDQFWIDLLEEFECNYYVTKSSDFDERIVEINEQLKLLWNKFDSIKNFERE